MAAPAMIVNGRHRCPDHRTGDGQPDPRARGPAPGGAHRPARVTGLPWSDQAFDGGVESSAKGRKGT
jgi:hypothetical protein